VGQRNHAVNDSSLPKQMDLAENILAMLLNNEIVELGLNNGSIGTIKAVV
jgi:hypothetical protein